MSERQSPIKYFISGGVGGVASVSLGYPMDTIKVKLQTMPTPKPGEAPMYTGIYDCFKKTVKVEGIRVLFKGILAPVLVAAPVNAVNFCGFAVGKLLLAKSADHIYTKPEIYAAGTFAGLCTSVLVAPSEHIKCRLQVDGGSPNPKYKGSIDCFKKLYAEGGIRLLYKGTLITITRDMPAVGMFFMCYETLKEFALNKNASPIYNLIASILCGGCAGITYWMVAMPADVLKTRFQTAPPGKYRDLKHVFTDLINKEGPKGFYHGLTPVLIRAYPVHILMFIAFEVTLKICDWIIPDV